ncbi:MAG TPA: hypothetical protein VIG33_10595 [Pseudobdellovibrionaceae bacterium]|jgi:hypothetical protein
MNNIAVRFYIRFIIFSFVFYTTFVTSAKAMAEDKVVIGYFSTENQETFEKNVKPAFERLNGACKKCEIMNLTPYDEKGVYSEKDLLEKLKNSPPEISFYFFSWNKKATDRNKELISALGEKIEGGKLVIAPTGQAAEGEPGLPLSRTLMGQTKDVIIIGEIIGNERMLPQSYFGPEMLTALRAPKDLAVQGMGPMYFVGRLANNWSKRKPEEWLQHFKTKKIKSRKIWLDADDLFGR